MKTDNLNIADRWLIIVAVMSVTLMQVLDTTIINVALPHMQGALGTTSDQISWTLTSYLVASCIFMPLTGYFSDIFGRKRYLLLCIGGFTLASALCGASQTLGQILCFRLLQGICGAALVPLSQSIVMEVYSKKEQGKAMAIWGTGVMVGPIFGPTLGGYLTDVLNWRWTFYVNIPIGILAIFLVWQVVPSTAKKNRGMDWIGLTLISLAIGAFQYFLDRGNQDDWLNATNIQIALVFTLITFISFLIYNYCQRLAGNPLKIFDLYIFKDRNFVIASLLLAIIGLGLYGVLVVQPIFLENLLNYPVLSAGWVMAPRGISSMIGMILVGKIVNRVDPRLLVAIGIIFNVIGLYFCTFYSLDIDTWQFIWPTLLQGFGLGMIIVPLSVVAFSTLSNHAKVEATGLYSLVRTLGSSVGIAVILTLFTRHIQVAWNHLGGFVNPYNPHFLQYFDQLHLSPTNSLAIAVVGNVIVQQAQMLALIHVFAFIMWSFVIMLPLLLLLKRSTL